jgi:hypothetical protein
MIHNSPPRKSNKKLINISNDNKVTAEPFGTLTALFLGHPSNTWSLEIPLSEVGATYFSPCCDKDLVIIFTTDHLTLTLLETGVGANDCKCSRDQRLNLPSKARK